jgi:hypothetical protein
MGSPMPSGPTSTKTGASAGGKAGAAATAKAAAAGPRGQAYEFLVYNASVFYYRCVRECLVPGIARLFVRQHERFTLALDAIADTDYQWRVRFWMALARCHEDAGAPQEAQRCAAVALDLATRYAPGIRAEAYRFVVGINAAQPANLAKIKGEAGTSRELKALYVVESVRSLRRLKVEDAVKPEQVAGEIKDAMSMLGVSLDGTEVAASTTASGKKDNKKQPPQQQQQQQRPPSPSQKGSQQPKQTPLQQQQQQQQQQQVGPLDMTQQREDELVAEVGRAALEAGLIPAARACAVHAGRSRFLSARLLSEFLFAQLALAELDKGEPPLGARAVDVRSKALKRLENAELSAIKLGVPLAIEDGAALIWNMALPLLQPNLRARAKSALEVALKGLESVGSARAMLRAQILLELSFCNLDDNLVVKAHRDAELGLHAHYAVPEAISSAFGLQRPLDRFLLPQRLRAGLKAGVLQVDPEGDSGKEAAINKALLALEQARDVKDARACAAFVEEAIAAIEASERLTALLYSGGDNDRKPQSRSQLVAELSDATPEAEARLLASHWVLLWAELAKAAWRHRLRALAKKCATRAIEEEASLGVLRGTQGSFAGVETAIAVAGAHFVLAEVEVATLKLDFKTELHEIPEGSSSDALPARSSAVSHFLAGAKIGADYGLQWLMINSAVYLWNYLLPAFAQERHQDHLAALGSACKILATAGETTLRPRVVHAFMRACEEAAVTPSECLTALMAQSAAAERAAAPAVAAKGTPKKDSQQQQQQQQQKPAAGAKGKGAAVPVKTSLPAELEVTALAWEVYTLPGTTDTLLRQALQVFEALPDSVTALQRKDAIETAVRIQKLLKMPATVKGDAAAQVIALLQASEGAASAKDKVPILEKAVALLRDSKLDLVELWVRVADEAWAAGLPALCSECADRAIASGRASLGCEYREAARGALPPRQWRWLAVAHGLRGQAHATTVVPARQERAYQEALLLEAAGFLVSACRLAAHAALPDAVGFYASHLWNTLSVAFFSSAALRRTARPVVADLLSVCEGIDMSAHAEVLKRFQDVHVRSLLESGEDELAWRAAGAALEVVPGSIAKPLWEARVVAALRLGKSLEPVSLFGTAKQDPAAVKERQLTLMLTVARNSTTPKDALAAYRGAVAATASHPVVQAELLAEYATWLFAADLPAQDARDALRSAADRLSDIEAAAAPPSSPGGAGGGVAEGSDGEGSQSQSHRSFRTSRRSAALLRPRLGLSHVLALARVNTMLARISDDPRERLASAMLAHGYVEKALVWALQAALAPAWRPDTLVTADLVAAVAASEGPFAIGTSPVNPSEARNAYLEALPGSRSVPKPHEVVLFAGMLAEILEAEGLEMLAPAPLGLAEIVARAVMRHGALASVLAIRRSRVLSAMGASEAAARVRATADYRLTEAQRQLHREAVKLEERSRALVRSAAADTSSAAAAGAPGSLVLGEDDMLSPAPIREVWVDLAALLIDEGSFGPAEELLAEADRHCSSFKDRRVLALCGLHLARLEMLKGEPARAQALLDRARSAGPGREAFWRQSSVLLSACLQAQGDSKSAKAVIDSALKALADLEASRRNLGWALRSSAAVELRSARAALSLAEAEALVFLGDHLPSCSAMDEARLDARRALRELSEGERGLGSGLAAVAACRVLYRSCFLERRGRSPRDCYGNLRVAVSELAAVHALLEARCQDAQAEAARLADALDDSTLVQSLACARALAELASMVSVLHARLSHVGRTHDAEIRPRPAPQSFPVLADGRPVPRAIADFLAEGDPKPRDERDEESALAWATSARSSAALPAEVALAECALGLALHALAVKAGELDRAWRPRPKPPAPAGPDPSEEASSKKAADNRGKGKGKVAISSDRAKSPRPSSATSRQSPASSRPSSATSASARARQTAPQTESESESDDPPEVVEARRKRRETRAREAEEARRANAPLPTVLSAQAVERLRVAIDLSRGLSASPASAAAVLDDSLVSDCALALCECYGNRDPVRAMQALLCAQSFAVRGPLARLARQAAAPNDREAVFQSLVSQLKAAFPVDPAASPALGPMEAYLRARSVSLRRLDCSAPVEDALGAVPAGCATMVCVFDPVRRRCVSGVLSGASTALACVDASPEDLQAMEAARLALVKAVRAQALAATAAEPNADLSPPQAEASGPAKGKKAAEAPGKKLTKAQAEEAERERERAAEAEAAAARAAAEEALRPREPDAVAAQLTQLADRVRKFVCGGSGGAGVSAVQAAAQASPGGVLILASWELLALPLEFALCPSSAAASRDLSVHMLMHRSKGLVADPKTGLAAVNKARVGYVVDGHAESLRGMCAAFERDVLRRPYTKDWVGVLGTERQPSVAEWQRLLADGRAAFIHEAHGQLPVTLAAGLDLSSLTLAILADRVASAASDRREAARATAKGRMEVLLDDHLPTAALLSLRGAGAVVVSQWSLAELPQHLFLNSLLNKLDGGASLSVSLTGARQSGENITPVTTQAQVLYGLPALQW